MSRPLPTLAAAALAAAVTLTVALRWGPALGLFHHTLAAAGDPATSPATATARGEDRPPGPTAPPPAPRPSPDHAGLAAERDRLVERVAELERQLTAARSAVLVYRQALGRALVQGDVDQRREAEVERRARELARQMADARAARERAAPHLVVICCSEIGTDPFGFVDVAFAVRNGGGSTGFGVALVEGRWCGPQVPGLPSGPIHLGTVDVEVEARSERTFRGHFGVPTVNVDFRPQVCDVEVTLR